MRPACCWLLWLWAALQGAGPRTDGFLQKNRKTALLQGDIVIGALVSVHHQPKKQAVKTLTCGEVSTSLGILLFMTTALQEV